MENKFSELIKKNFLPYVSPKFSRDRSGAIRALRYTESPLDCWPFDLNSFLTHEKIHRSIHRGEPIGDSVDFCKSWLILFPGEFVTWMATNSFQAIVDQWVSFFATWQVADHAKGVLAFQQSPAVLHDRIAARCDGFLSKMAGVDDDHWEAEFSSLIKGLPPWLDIRNGGEVDGLCSYHNFWLARFGASDEDVARSIDLNDPLTGRMESDADAFTFWKHAAGGPCWPKIPGMQDDRDGFVYLIHDGELFKIGFTRELPQKRLASLQTGSSRKLDLVAHIQGSPHTERSLHRHFSHKRIRGEWFLLNENDIREAFAVTWES